MSVDWMHIFMLVTCWVIYFALHSFLASYAAKQWCVSHYPGFFPWYRLSYNLAATLLLLAPLWLTFSQPSEMLIEYEGALQILAWSITVLSVIGFFVAGGIYNSERFIGIEQIKTKDVSIGENEAFHISFFHRYVRHPWYFLALLLIWSQEMNVLHLTSAIMLTLYLIIGSYWEERKLIKLYGDVYRTYLQLVPGLLPWPGKYLTLQQSESLLQGKVD